MSRLNLDHLTLTAAQNIQTANKVRRDPAVVKASKQFAVDEVNPALLGQSRSPWMKSVESGTVDCRSGRLGRTAAWDQSHVACTERGAPGV
jgi:hypothetical protein